MKFQPVTFYHVFIEMASPKRFFLHFFLSFEIICGPVIGKNLRFS